MMMSQRGCLISKEEEDGHLILFSFVHILSFSSSFSLLRFSHPSSQMMIIEDEHIFKAETTMIGEKNSIIKEDEINDLSMTKRNEEFFKSPNKRKQIKPNR
jgi:hypothetical protein